MAASCTEQSMPCSEGQAVKKSAANFTSGRRTASSSDYALLASGVIAVVIALILFGLDTRLCATLHGIQDLLPVSDLLPLCNE